jgi:hypothetical protein
MVIHQYKAYDRNAGDNLTYSDAIYPGDEILIILKHPIDGMPVGANVKIPRFFHTLHIFPPLKLIVNLF